MYAKITSGSVDQYPYTIGQLRRDNPNTSFPKRPDDALLSEWGLHRVVQTDSPTVNHTKDVVEGAPALVNGTWTQVWETTDATVEEIAERTEQATNSVRSERDNLLSETDWVTIKAIDTSSDGLGIQIPQTWVDYRQALRDITSHANFPWLDDADWPVKP